MRHASATRAFGYHLGMRALLCLLLLVSGCAVPVSLASPDATSDSSVDVDASHHVELDSGVDAGPTVEDAGADAEADAGTDATVCECTSGPCCDGCHHRPATWQCSTRSDGPDTIAQCGILMMNVCGASGWSRIERGRIDRWCTGDSSECTGRTTGTPVFVSTPCDVDGASPWASACVLDTSALGAHCEPCPSE